MIMYQSGRDKYLNHCLQALILQSKEFRSIVGINSRPQPIPTIPHEGKQNTADVAGSAAEIIQQEILSLGSNVDGLFLKASV